MNKILIPAVALSLTLAFAAGAAAQQLNVTSLPFGDVTVHVLSSAAGSNATVVESDKLVLFDAFQDEDGQAYKQFVDSLGKPVDRIILSHEDDHHWIGVNDLFPGAALYSVDAEAINAAAPLNVQVLNDGSQVISGVTYDFVSYRELGAWVIKMPAQKVAMLHHVGYIGLHFTLPPMDARLAIVKGLEAEGYQWYISGHGLAPVDATFVQQISDYNDFAAKAIAANPDPQSAKAAIVAQYPGWADFLLDSMLPMFYQN